MSVSHQQLLEATTPPEMAGERVDRVLSMLFPDYSRSRITEWIRRGEATVDGRTCQPKERLAGGEKLTLRVITEIQAEAVAQPIPLEPVFEDEHLLVINKPAGLVVHPAAGNPDGTLLNALLYHYPDQALLPRAGIVHRLDKDTTGLMVVARSELARTALVEQLQEREMGREYVALVSGTMTGGGKVDAPIGRHPTVRTKMAVHPLGKPAVTHYRILQRFTAHTLLQVNLETGRTHQIRVHMAHLHHPLVGDSLYAGRARLPAGVSQAVKDRVRAFPRQALHARALRLRHPASNEQMFWEAAVPDDMQQLLDTLAAETEGAGDA